MGEPVPPKEVVESMVESRETEPPALTTQLSTHLLRALAVRVGSPMHHKCLWVRMKISPLLIACEALHIPSPSGFVASRSNCGLALMIIVSLA